MIMFYALIFDNLLYACFIFLISANLFNTIKMAMQLQCLNACMVVLIDTSCFRATTVARISWYSVHMRKCL